MAQHRTAKRRSQQRLAWAGRRHRRGAGGRHRREFTAAGRRPGVPAPAVAVTAAALVAGGGALAGVLPAHADRPGSALQPVAAVGYTGTDPQRSDRRGNQASRDAERKALERARLAKLRRAATQQAAQRNARLADLARAAEKRAIELAAEDWVLPTSGYRITAGFGEVSNLWTSVHTGLDFAAARGTPVVSVDYGVVTKVGYAGAYGNRVEVMHDDGTATWYCHLDAFRVRVGDTVDPEQRLGTVGSTGNTTGPHLHFEVRPGGVDPVDPYLVLIQHGVLP